MGKFNAQDQPQRIIGHNIPMALLGAFLLWIGWFGFNGGATLKASAEIGRVIVNTNLAGAAGALACLTVGWPYRKRADLFDLVNGGLGGLVAITACAAYVEAPVSVGIGAIAGLLVFVGSEWLERCLKLDDVVGCVPVHAFCGAWGSLAAGIFSNPDVLLYPTNRVYHVGIQILGSATCFLLAFGGGLLFFLCLNRVIPLRASPEDERRGFNLSEHYAITSTQQLIDMMRDIAQQRDWKRRAGIDPYGDPEAGELALWFNKLLDTIEETVEALKDQRRQVVRSQQELLITNTELERSKTSLEAQVRKRTQELESTKASLEFDIEERTRQVQEAHDKLQTKFKELELLNRVMMGREERILELKDQLRNLQTRLGRPTRHRSKI